MKKLLLFLVFVFNAFHLFAFDYTYKGVTFKCKTSGNTVTITGFERKASDVVIPAQVQYKGRTYFVKEVDTFVNGDNYSARTLVLEEGIERIGRSAFVEFRKLESVTLPRTIVKIGRNAFRDNDGLEFNIPPTIDEVALRNGDSQTPSGYNAPKNLLAQQERQKKEEARIQQKAEKHRKEIERLQNEAEKKQRDEARKQEKKAQKGEMKTIHISTLQSDVSMTTTKPIKSVTAANPKVVEPQPSDEEFLSDIDVDIPVSKKVNNHTYCYIIANEHYDDAPDVEYALRDGKMVREYMEKTCGVPSRHIKMYPNATGGTIKKALFDMTCIERIDPHARLIFYYAGHGLPSEKDQSAYIVPTDGSPKYDGTCISMKEVYETLGNIHTESVIVLLDACFNGIQKGKDLAVLSARGMARSYKPEVLSGKVIVFSASSGDETALSYKEKKHGLFTYFLLHKLQETKGRTSLGEWFKYVEENVRREAYFSNDKFQTPQCQESPEMKGKWENIYLSY